jgi:hypothetical protein
MRKISFRFVLCFLTWIFLASPALGQKLSLRFAGGVSFPSLDHINQSLQDFERFYKTRGQVSENWTFIQGEARELNSVIELEGEVLYRLSPRFALGLATGYFYSEVTEEETTLELQYQDDPQQLYTIPTKIYAHPLTVAAYTFFHLSGKIQAYLKAGGGLIWATHVKRLGDKEISQEDFRYTQSETASAQGSILFGGMGISAEIDRGMSFFVEGNIRRSKISGFTGQITTERTGTLYYYEEYEPGLDIWVAHNKIFENEPSDDDIRAVEELVIDLSGVSVKIGIIVKF